MKTGKFTASEMDFIRAQIAKGDADAAKIAKVLDRSESAIKGAITRERARTSPATHPIPLEQAITIASDPTEDAVSAPPTEDAEAQSDPMADTSTPPIEPDAVFTTEQLAHINMLAQEFGLARWLAEFVVTNVPEEHIPEHAVRLLANPVCQLTGARLTEANGAVSSAEYLPNDNMIVAAFMARMVGANAVADFVHMCTIVAEYTARQPNTAD